MLCTGVSTSRVIMTAVNLPDPAGPALSMSIHFSVPLSLRFISSDAVGRPQERTGDLSPSECVLAGALLAGALENVGTVVGPGMSEGGLAPPNATSARPFSPDSPARIC